MPFKWKDKIVSFGSSSSDLAVSAGTSYTIPANTTSHWVNATISGNLYVHRTADFRVSGTLTIGSTGNIIAVNNVAGESGSGTAYAATTADDTLPASSNGANGTGAGKNSLKIMANKLINNGTISASADYNNTNSGTGASGGFIWIISPDISGGAGIRISCDGAEGGPAWASERYCVGNGVWFANCAGGGDGCYNYGGSDYVSGTSGKHNSSSEGEYCVGGGSGPKGTSGTASSILIVTSKNPSGGTASNQTVSLDTTMKSLSLGTILWFEENKQWNTP